MTSESRREDYWLRAVLRLETVEPFYEMLSDDFMSSPEFTTDLLHGLADRHSDRFISERFSTDTYHSIFVDDMYIEDYYVSSFDCYMTIVLSISLRFRSKNSLNKFKLTNPEDYAIFTKYKPREICHTN
jgi:hypothetical protein